MTNSRAIDAAGSARQEDQLLTDIAQIGPGNTAKAQELLMNGSLPSDLMAAFESAANSAQEIEHLQAFNLQQQEKTVLQQQQAEEKHEKDEHDAWLDSMSPEYQQAYSHLMTTVDNADSQYDQMRDRLKQRGQALDQDAQDIDDNALHLSDGNRAYVNAQGVLVDRNGVPLKGQEATEAKSLAEQKTTPISTFTSYQQNQQSRADVNTLSQRVDTEESEANRFKQDVKDGKVRDTAKVQEGDANIQSKLAATHEKEKSTANEVSMADLDGDSVQPAAPSDRSSFASHIDQDAGIKASGLTAPFNANAATQGTPAPVAAPVPIQKPALGAPAPN